MSTALYWLGVGATGAFTVYGMITAAYRGVLLAFDWYGRREARRFDREVAVKAAARERLRLHMERAAELIEGAIAEQASHDMQGEVA